MKQNYHKDHIRTVHKYVHVYFTSNRIKTLSAEDLFFVLQSLGLCGANATSRETSGPMAFSKIHRWKWVNTLRFNYVYHSQFVLF